jgi:acetyl-CoA carboxylase, biotin carboxylase subunit
LVRKVLIANRGEIAVRVVRAAREAGIGTVAVYSPCDRGALHVRLADEAWPLAGNAPADSYLCIDAILDVAIRAGADAIHPGYGFLAENAEFAQACLDQRLTFIGPTPEAIRLMGSKTAARRVAAAAGVPVVPGTENAIPAGATDADVLSEAERIGYPLMLKAVAGGGGKGMRVVESAEALAPALRAARSEAQSSFGNPAVYLERRLARPRHIEVQLLGDVHGGIVPFVERECSIQRRHQKVLEESPSPAVGAALRQSLTAAAARVAAEAGYTNAGTIEFLVDDEDRFYFLEMNTRLQVEHPITEAVTGVDLVQWQFRLAEGARLSLDADAARHARGHAIECRIYAEDPDRGFLPSPGRVSRLRAPQGPFVRDDGSLVAPGDVPVFYDSLISKLVTWGNDRTQAIARMYRALDEYDVVGVQTTIPFFRWLLREPAFLAGEIDTGYLDRALAERNGDPFVTADAETIDVAVIAAAIHAFTRSARDRRPQPASAWTRKARAESVQ